MKDDRSLSFVVYDMAESEEEDITEKVNHLLASQLKLGNVYVTEAEPKPKPPRKGCGCYCVEVCNRMYPDTPRYNVNRKPTFVC